METIIDSLEKLGYHVTWNVLNSANFGLPQERKRIYIVGTKDHKTTITNFQIKNNKLKNILEVDKETVKSKFTDLLLSHYSIGEHHGKSITDKRGGKIIFMVGTLN